MRQGGHKGCGCGGIGGSGLGNCGIDEETHTYEHFEKKLDDIITSFKKNIDYKINTIFPDYHISNEDLNFYKFINENYSDSYFNICEFIILGKLIKIYF